jgi:hypothetical protein
MPRATAQKSVKPRGISSALTYGRRLQHFFDLVLRGDPILQLTSGGKLAPLGTEIGRLGNQTVPMRFGWRVETAGRGWAGLPGFGGRFHNARLRFSGFFHNDFDVWLEIT